jgi:cytochrome c oxidase subunit 4
MQTQAEEHHDHPLVPYNLYVKVWGALMVLTVITVAVSYVDMKQVTVLTACLIAAAKGSLVILYFMHIRFERRLYAIMIMVIFVTYAVFIGLTFVDYWYR